MMRQAFEQKYAEPPLLDERRKVTVDALRWEDVDVVAVRATDRKLSRQLRRCLALANVERADLLALCVGMTR